MSYTPPQDSFEALVWDLVKFGIILAIVWIIWGCSQNQERPPIPAKLAEVEREYTPPPFELLETDTVYIHDSMVIFRAYADPEDELVRATTRLFYREETLWLRDSVISTADYPLGHWFNVYAGPDSGLAGGAWLL